MAKGTIVYVIDAAREFGKSVWTKSSVPNHMTIRYPKKGRLEIERVPYQTVFDVSLLNFAERIEFTNKFCQGIMDNRKNSTHNPDTYIFFEEAHLYFPQGSMTLSRRRAKQHDWEGQAVELATVGRNCHVLHGAITRFPSMVDKLLIKNTNQRYFGRTSEPNDVDYIEDIIGKKLALELPKLDVGEFVYSYPKRGHESGVVAIPMFKRPNIKVKARM